MSYDISLYNASFLKRAISEGLGDWTKAPPLPTEIVNKLVQAVLELGFTHVMPDPGFVAFLQSKGRVPGAEYKITTPVLDLSLTIFPVEAAFSVPYSDASKASIEFVHSFTKDFAQAHGLGIYDPQEGKSWFTDV